MIQAMYSGVSGMQAFETDLNVIGNNIANINTPGFKSSNVTFSDMMTQLISGGSSPSSTTGGTNPTQIGLGVAITSVNVNTTQGSLTSTGTDTDLAIQGNGYFLLGDGTNAYYSRDGSFTLDANNNLVSAGSGYKVLGWTADSSGNIDASQAPSPGGIVIPGGTLSNAQQTTLAVFGDNLDAGAATGATASPDVNVYDSLGVSHEIKVTFTKTANPAEWSYDVYCPDVGKSAVASGTLSFDASGAAETDKAPVSLTFAKPNGSTSPMDFDVSLGQITQEAGTSTVAAISQDGVSTGTLQSFSIGADGTIVGAYRNSSDNATKQVLGRIALADFSNPAASWRPRQLF